MTPRPATLLLLFTALTLGGCAADKESYPSLAVRPVERVNGTLQPIAPQPLPAPQPGADVLDQVTQLRAAAADADRRFQVAIQAARAPVNAARGTAPGSERWSVAEVALSDAEARHNEAMAALSGLDQIYVAAQMDGNDTGAIETAVNEVTTTVEAQDRTIEQLQAGLTS